MAKAGKVFGGSAKARAVLALSVSLAFIRPSLCVGQSGAYQIRADQPQQVIQGLGFEIQSDSIGSGNAGMPDTVVAVPHDLTPNEKQRFYKEMLHGFRYSRLAMGLYLRGNDPEKKHIVERYPGQMEDLRAMQQVSGIEGFDVEYWSPAPFWKQGTTYYGGSIRANDPIFLAAFSDAMVDDLKYLQAHGLRVAQWGLQNEPAIGLAKRIDPMRNPLDAKQSYGTCYYSPEDYAAVLKVTVPKVRALLPTVQIHAPSWDGPAGAFAAEIRKDPNLLKNIDAWTWHQIGHNSNDQIDQQAKYMQGADGKPVYQNEFEYQPWDTKKIDSPFMNTGQALMNWLVFENSPTWYWLHALKPVTNLEASGYSLGFWRPAGVLKQDLSPSLQEGHWEFNSQNWNAVAGFLKYMPWDSTRLTVEESTVQHDQRILVWRSKQGKLGIALSNRGKEPYTFHISGAAAQSISGYRYTISALNIPLGEKSGEGFSITVPPESFEFWMDHQVP
jgi:hypothetical protein